MSNFEAVSSADMRCFAYKIGYMSKYRIEREARKTEPRLFKLIGHASLFDSAKKYIVEHIDDDDDEDDFDHDDELSDDLTSIDHIEELDLDDDVECAEALPPSYAESQSQHQYYQASTKRISRPVQRPQQVVLATPAEDGLPHHYETEDWENVSDVSTEAGDSDSDSDWSEATCEGDEHVVDAVTAASHPARKILDMCELPTSQFSMPTYEPVDDDLVLWAQQPKVFSQSQADNLLVDIFA
ncbi:hypothetical protein A1O3_04036 [Capronia epimyces CBS 606.96]|uniref:Uncharacterized protein n=1 Tax=Capronia epimyces CBS 606.96 TaxID=1182542 RepID=W9Y3K2_9EURO|nr:uncharacterized protein A1O3_04036 [Capronia epimyces CBS 606.96]EXJ87078.1 hypothetical protein A1O3_04036 [Capronia epimyces CBS 606.96]